MKKAFSEIDIYQRNSKPRDRGITMMIDWGEGLCVQKDKLQFTGEFFDLAKIAVGISALLSPEVLREKINLYKEYDVEPFLGGMFLELAVKQDKLDYYFKECKRVGYTLIEVSDNVVHFSDNQRSEIISRAREDYGFKVLAEVGSKHVDTNAEVLINDIKISQEAGAWKTLVEAAEFFQDDIFNDKLIKDITSVIPEKNLIFELPGKWIKGVHSHQINSMVVWLIENLGSNVNIGNLMPEDVIRLETLRTGLGTSMKL